MTMLSYSSVQIPSRFTAATPCTNLCRFFDLTGRILYACARFSSFASFPSHDLSLKIEWPAAQLRLTSTPSQYVENTLLTFEKVSTSSRRNCWLQDHSSLYTHTSFSSNQYAVFDWYKVPNTTNDTAGQNHNLVPRAIHGFRPDKWSSRMQYMQDPCTFSCWVSWKGSSWYNDGSQLLHCAWTFPLEAAWDWCLKSCISFCWFLSLFHLILTDYWEFTKTVLITIALLARLLAPSNNNLTYHVLPCIKLIFVLFRWVAYGRPSQGTKWRLIDSFVWVSVSRSLAHNGSKREHYNPRSLLLWHKWTDR